ncbi:MAG TPA: acyltransferase [Candidatus Kapabacteria bacterium]|jgi:peptidoglycan/LPS O-acetylase OafA/YrhL|nr:acyltransferase [Candidatus Kapabacteria bacterium]
MVLFSPLSLPNTPIIRDKHYPALDGLRGIAALMVVAHHSAFSYGMTGFFDKAYLRATSLLWVGVDLFFVLSGFLITNILLETKHSPNYFRTFYARRFLRIFPLYYAFLAVLYFLVPLLGSPLPESLTSVQAWQWTYTSNIYVGFHGWSNQNINHLWSLSIEEQFYLVWPLLVLILREQNLKEAIVGLLLFLPFIRSVCLSIGLPAYFITSFTLCRMDGLLLGALISLMLREGLLEKIRLPQFSRILKRLDWTVTILVAAFIVVYCILRNDQFLFNALTWPWYGQCIGFSLVSLPLAYIVFRSIADGPSRLKRILEARPLRAVGKYSYALYLLHAPIVFWAGAHFPVPNVLKSLPPQWSFLHSIYIIFVQFTLSIFAAILSWHIIEKHFLKLKKYFRYRPAPPETVLSGNASIVIGEAIA